MSLQRWSENVVLVELAAEPKTAEEIEEVISYVREYDDCGVVMDFQHVTILTSTALASLLRLKKLLESCERRLLLCSVSQATRGIISVTGLDDFFDIAKDRFDALATVQAMPEGPSVQAGSQR